MSTASALTAAAGGAISHRHAPAQFLQSLPLSGHSCFRSDVTFTNLKATLRHSLSGSRIHATTTHSEGRQRAVTKCQAAAEKETVAVTGEESHSDFWRCAGNSIALSDPSHHHLAVRVLDILGLTFASRPSWGCQFLLRQP